MLSGERTSVVRTVEASDGAGSWMMGLALAGFLAILVRMLVAV